MLTTITVKIYNWNCYNNNQKMVLDVDKNGNLVINPVGTSPSQVWTLIPNLVTGAHQAAGFTIYNQALNGSAEQPADQQQIPLGDDPTPFGSLAYCWTLWDAGTSSNTQLWAIQSATRGDTMDAYEQGTKAGTQVVFWNWNGGNNQKWVIVPN